MIRATTATLQNEYQRSGRISLLSFYKRRILRLAPALIAVCVVVSIFCFSVNYEGRLTDLLFVLTYTVNWARALGVASPLYLGHAWSLAIEEQFYLFWPFALIALYWAAPRRPSVALRAAIALALGCALWRVVAYQAGFGAERIYNGTDTHVDGLFLGCALALYSTINPEALKTIGRFWPVALVAFVAVVVGVRSLDGFVVYGGYLAIAVCSAIFVAAAHGDSLLRRLLDLPPLVWTGRRSYGLYLWVTPTLSVGLVMGLPFAWAGAVSLFGSLAIAAASYRWIEQPVLALRYRRSRVTA